MDIVAGVKPKSRHTSQTRDVDNTLFLGNIAPVSDPIMRTVEECAGEIWGKDGGRRWVESGRSGCGGSKGWMG